MKKLLACLCLTVSFTSFATNDLLDTKKSRKKLSSRNISKYLNKNHITDSTNLLWSSRNLKGVIPPSIGQLTRLSELDLSGNRLTGPIPPEIGKLTNLKNLNLNNNQLTGLIPEIGELTNLARLSLSRNQLTGPIPEIGKLTLLTNLNLFNNQLTGSIPESIGNLFNLASLNLSRNQFTGPIPESIGNLEKLEFLYLNNNQLTGLIPKSIGNLENLDVLNLFENQLTDLPTTILNFEHCTIDLTGNHISRVVHEENQILRGPNGRNIIIGVGGNDSINIMNTIIALRNLPRDQVIKVHFSHVQDTEFKEFEGLHLSLGMDFKLSRPTAPDALARSALACNAHIPPSSYSEAIKEVLTIIQRGEPLTHPIKSARK